MGFGKFLKGLVGGSEAVQPPAPTLANDDSELLELWRDRSTLTPGSRDELRVEMGIRGLVIPFDRPDPRTWITHVLPPELLPAAKADDDDDDDDDDGGDISIGGDPVVQLLSTWLVALKPSPDVTLVVSLPVWTPEPAPTQIPKGLHAAALIALGSVPPGTARSVGTEEVIDGIPAESTSYGATTLEPLGGGVLIHGEDARVLVGAGISLAEIAKHGPTHIVGGIRWPTSEEEWAAIVAAWTPETSSRLRGIWVLSDVVGTASHTSLSLADRMGIPAFLSASQLPVSVAAEALVTAAHRGDTSTLADLAKDAGEDALIEALAHALFRGAHSEAEKVLAAADGVNLRAADMDDPAVAQRRRDGPVAEASRVDSTPRVVRHSVLGDPAAVGRRGLLGLGLHAGPPGSKCPESRPGVDPEYCEGGASTRRRLDPTR